MYGYKLYFLDRGGHIHSFLDLECESDDAAVRFVEAHEDGCAKELWHQARRVQAFPAKRKPWPVDGA